MNAACVRAAGTDIQYATVALVWRFWAGAKPHRWAGRACCAFIDPAGFTPGRGCQWCFIHHLSKQKCEIEATSNSANVSTTTTQLLDPICKI